jgi:uncharacterized protein (DUF2236 family)
MWAREAMAERPTLREVFAGMPTRPAPRRSGDPGMFVDGSVARRINAETALLLGGGRALLMQIAHPLVAAGVADHSGFERDPFSRLWRTLDVTLTVSFGDSRQSRAAAAEVAAVHRRVRGTRDGITYDAMDPALLLWVHATIVDTALATYDRFIRPLSPAIADRYHEEMKRQAAAFGVPAEALPENLPAFRAYVASTIDGLRVSDEARRLTDGILRPPAPLSLAPVSASMRLVTVGLLPPPLREAFGLRWNAPRARAFDALAATSRMAVPRLPAAVRYWPHARAGRQNAGVST